jgi:hypothetical protein
MKEVLQPQTPVVLYYNEAKETPQMQVRVLAMPIAVWRLLLSSLTFFLDFIPNTYRGVRTQLKMETTSFSP